MNSLNNFNTDLSAILESIKEFNKKYSNDFFGIELKKSAPVGVINHSKKQIEYLNKITENIEKTAPHEVQEQTEIITEITEEALGEFDDEFDEDMKGEVESVMLEMVDEIELMEQDTEEQEPVRNNEWTCKFCNKLLKTKDKNRHYNTNRCLEEKTRRGQ